MTETGIILPYEKQAMQGADVPEGLAWYDRVMFLALRSLYWQYQQGIISRGRAVKDKNQMLSDYAEMKKQQGYVDYMHRAYMKTDTAICKYRKDRTLENADALVQAIDGVEVRHD